MDKTDKAVLEEIIDVEIKWIEDKIEFWSDKPRNEIPMAKEMAQKEELLRLKQILKNLELI